MDRQPPAHSSSIRLGHSCIDIALSESFSLHCALLPPPPPSGSSEIGACGPGRGRARAGLWGGSLSRAWWPPPRPSSGIWACPRLPTQAILGGSIEEEQGRKEEERGREKEGREGKGREGKESRPSKLASIRQPQSGISSKIHYLNSPLGWF